MTTGNKSSEEIFIEVEPVTSKIRFGFKGKNQLSWFMVWREYWSKDEVVFAKVLFSIG
jgi:hypothetical protein